MSVILIGYRGCGKTTIGRRLADRLWQKFVDTDDLIVAKAAKSIREIFADEGEDRFRELESQVIAEVVKFDEHVIALGGGAVLREENRKLLRSRNHRIIYLHCEPVVLHQRIAADPQTAQMRPNLTKEGGGLTEIKILLEQRLPLYRQTMHSELEVTNLTPDEAVVYIARML